MQNSQNLYDIYCRKSQEDEDRQVLSLEAQEKECREYAAKNGIKIRKLLLESFSAKSPGRKQFSTMMQDIADGKIQGILAWHPDRLSRNSVDGGLIIYYLDQGCLKDLVFPTYHFENNPQGKWMLNIQFGQSKYYIDSLSVNVKRGNRLKLEKGWRPNMAPAGYLNNKEDKTIIADPIRFLMLVGAATPPGRLAAAVAEAAAMARGHADVAVDVLNLAETPVEICDGRPLDGYGHATRGAVASIAAAAAVLRGAGAGVGERTRAPGLDSPQRRAIR